MQEKRPEQIPAGLHRFRWNLPGGHQTPFSRPIASKVVPGGGIDSMQRWRTRAASTDQSGGNDDLSGAFDRCLALVTTIPVRQYSAGTEQGLQKVVPQASAPEAMAEQLQVLKRLLQQLWMRIAGAKQSTKKIEGKYSLEPDGDVSSQMVKALDEPGFGGQVQLGGPDAEVEVIPATQIEGCRERGRCASRSPGPFRQNIDDAVIPGENPDDLGSLGKISAVENKAPSPEGPLHLRAVPVNLVKQGTDALDFPVVGSRNLEQNPPGSQFFPLPRNMSQGRKEESGHCLVIIALRYLGVQ